MKHCGCKMIGVEVRGLYDGVLYWLCDICGIMFHRFTGNVITEDQLPSITRDYP